MRYQNEETRREISHKNEEISALNRDILSWREVVERLNSENKELQLVIEDIENKNRKLVEKINEQIYMKAAEYKERTLQALTKNDSPSKLKQVLAD